MFSILSAEGAIDPNRGCKPTELKEPTQSRLLFIRPPEGEGPQPERSGNHSERSGNHSERSGNHSGTGRVPEEYYLEKGSWA
ncbi:MAG: hypothetical protein ACFCD0_12345 [Gemmataceae bacterium]